MLITTGYNFEGHVITQYIDVISASVVLGTGIFSSFGAAVADLSGSRGGMYEDKLEKGRKQALWELKKQAKCLGGNAILGIDVDYTTFDGDVMGIVATGTVVRIEKPKVQKDVGYSIPVSSYNLGLPFNVCTVNFENTGVEGVVFGSLEIKSYFEKGIATALIVDIELEDIFKNIVTLSDIVFRTHIYEVDAAYNTEFAKISVGDIRLDLMQKAYVTVKKVILNSSDKVVEVDVTNQIRNVQMNSADLEMLKKKEGVDVVRDLETLEDKWICYCGAENHLDTVQCYRCNKINKILDEQNKEIVRRQIASSKQQVWILTRDEAYKKGTAKELYEYYSSLAEGIDVDLEPMIYELKMIKKKEELTNAGSLKEEAIDRVKKMLEVKNKESMR